MAGRYDIQGDNALRVGANFSLTFTIKSSGTAVDNTGYSAYFKARKHQDSPTTVVAVSNSDHISLLGTSGQVRINIPYSTTANYAPGKYVYDFSMLSDTDAKDVYFYGTLEIVNLISR